MRKIDLSIELDITVGPIADLVALLLLADTLLVSLLLVNSEAVRELFIDLFSGSHRNSAAEPRVANDISDAESLVWLLLEHAGEKVFELLRVETFGLASRVRVRLPE